MTFALLNLISVMDSGQPLRGFRNDAGVSFNILQDQPLVADHFSRSISAMAAAGARNLAPEIM